MDFRRPRRPDFSIDMTPMIDCVFQLLIFFLLSSSFHSPAVALDLPRASADPAKTPAEVVVTIDAKGEIYVNRERLPRQAVQQRLSAILEKNRDQVVIIRADRGVPYGTVVGILDDAKKAGARKVNLAVEGEDKKGS